MFSRTYECPDCLGVFGFRHHPNSEPLVNFCPLCGNDMRGEAKEMPAAPAIARTIGKTADGVYRQMEIASAANAEAAAELGGGEAKDYAGLRVTNLADRLRPGDVAAKMPDNPVSRHMVATRQGGFSPVAGMSGADFAAGTARGDFPRQGEATRQELVRSHSDRARVTEAVGRMGRAK